MSTSTPKSRLKPVLQLWPFPDHRDLYLLVAGVSLGVLLSPAVLGQISPGIYDHFFMGGGEPGAELADFDDQTKKSILLLIESGATESAIDEYRDQRAPHRAVLEAHLQDQRSKHLWKQSHRMTGLILAVLVIMAIETLFGPKPAPGPRSDALVVPRPLGRLATIRYALLAVWIALAIARPQLLRSVPIVFTALLVAVALAAGLVPLARPSAATEDEG